MPIIYRKYEPPHIDPDVTTGKDHAPGPPDARADIAERDLTAIRRLISQDLSEPYGIYVYRYFIYQWPHLCFLALDDGDSGTGSSYSVNEQATTSIEDKAHADTQTQKDNLVGVVVCKLASHRGVKQRGYIAMLAVATAYRGRGIATKLVRMAIDRMIEDGADEIVLETEVDNESAIRLYEKMGFIRSKRMHRYYMNASDAFRLVLPVKVESTIRYCVLADEFDVGPRSVAD
ncbi:acyl-CoA N-acyltransferase [Lipomyces kononenkoae]